MRLFLLCLVCGWAVTSSAFIAPVSDLIADVFHKRKSADVVEIGFRHWVAGPGGEKSEVLEHIVASGASGVIRWQVSGAPPFYSEWNGRQYAFRGGAVIPSRTGAFNEYFLAKTGNQYLDRLLREQFIRRDQLLQFRPGYRPEGDPKTWPVKANYLLHSDVFYAPLGGGLVPAIVGLSENDQRRAIYVSPVSRGIERLEWKVENETAFWDFGSFAHVGGYARLPKSMSLQINGSDRVRTTLTVARASKDSALRQARDAFRNSAVPLPDAAGEAIRLILRYR